MTAPKPSAVTGTNPSGVSAPRSATVISSATTSEPTGASGWKPPAMPAETTRSYGVPRRAAAVSAEAADAAEAAGPTPAAMTSNGPVADVSGVERARRVAVSGLERLCHRVPFDGDRGGDEDAYP